MRWRDGVGRIAAAATMVGLVAAAMAGGGCEFVVDDTVPAFTCTAGVSGACPSGSVCQPSSHRCVAQTGTCTPGACPAGQACDATTLHCVAATPAPPPDGAPDSTTVGTPDAEPVADTGIPLPDGPVPPVEASLDDAADAAPPMDAPPETNTGCRAIGCDCSNPTNCESGICADALTLTQDLYQANKMSTTCTQPCCTSSDCPSGTVCFGTGQGGSYCVRPLLLGRTADLGTGIGGAACKNDAECRSGICTGATNGICADTCCSSAQQASECASGTICRFAAFQGHGFDVHQTGSCGTQIGGGTSTTLCTIDSSCQTGKCAGFTHCAQVCRSTADCPATQSCNYGIGPTPPTTKDIVQVCGTMSVGNAPDGMDCNSNNDCQSAFCSTMTKKCSDICFTDADCKSGARCSPQQVQTTIGGGSYSILSCGP